MAISLKNTHDLHVNGVKLLVYGQAGSGKTSLIPSLPSPIVLSAEGGCGDWEVLDRRGRPAAWLERKLTDRERSRIDEEVFEHMEEDEDDE